MPQPKYWGRSFLLILPWSLSQDEDDREPEDMWTQVEGRVDIILYEGWRVGIDHPLYAKFNSAIDCLICLEANVEAIRKWKLESSKRDAESAGKFFDEAKVNEAFNRDIVPFMKVYEEPLVNRADLVLRKAASHSILSLDHALIEKLESIADFRLHSSGRNELTIDSVEDALAEELVLEDLRQLDEQQRVPLLRRHHDSERRAAAWGHHSRAAAQVSRAQRGRQRAQHSQTAQPQAGSGGRKDERGSAQLLGSPQRQQLDDDMAQ